MQNENINLQAKVFLYHLNNSNSENGIRKDENWTLRQVSETARTEIERHYSPVVHTKVDAALMEEFSSSVLRNMACQPKLHLASQTIEPVAGSNYLVAFSSNRLRR
ncbi:MAG: hypothetical protein EOO45_18295 [Flavobacterium sp.]|nr:MAG: hypothetical protein EOO45_18295 [Flavobacterium sp.]